MARSERAKGEAAAEARAKAWRPPWRKKRVLLLLLLISMIVIVVASSGGKKTGTTTPWGSMATKAAGASDDNAPMADVKVVGACSKRSTDTVELPIRITNHSSKRSNYLIEGAAYYADGTTMADFVSYFDSIDPGAKLFETMVGQLPGGSVTVSKCEVLNVTRFAST